MEHLRDKTDKKKGADQGVPGEVAQRGCLRGTYGVAGRDENQVAGHEGRHENRPRSSTAAVVITGVFVNRGKSRDR